MDVWKKKLAKHYNNSCKLVALELHNSYSYIVVTKLHKLHTNIVPYIVSCVFCNSCNSFDNTHDVEICWVLMKLQMVIAIQKLSCKASYKSPFFP
jgi:hypothetical protein